MTLLTAGKRRYTPRQGGGIQIADAVRVCMAAGLTFLVMRQVMPIAAGLAHGAALQSYGAVSRAASWSARRGLGLARSGMVYAATLQPHVARRDAVLPVRRP